MKMKIGTRVLLTIFLIVIIAAFLFVLATIFGLVSPTHVQDIASTMTDGGIGYKILYAAVSVVIIIVALIIMFFGISKETPKTATVASFESGSILITVRAIEELVEKYIREFQHIKGLRTRVVSYSDSIDINVDISTLPEAVLPELTTQLQDGLKEDIQKHTGLTVRQVKIVIMEIDDKLKHRVD